MILVNSPKEFIITINWPVKVIEYENFHNACRRCNSQLETLCSNIEKSSVGQPLVDQIDQLKTDFSILDKEANILNLGDKTVCFSVILFVGYMNFHKQLGFLTKESLRKVKQFVNQPLIFPRFTESTAVRMGLIRRFLVVLRPKNKTKIHPDLDPEFRTPLHYNRVLEFLKVKVNLLGSSVEIPFDPGDGSAPALCKYTIFKVVTPKKSTIPSIFGCYPKQK